MQMPRKLLRFRQVKELVPLSRSEIYRRISLGNFPRQIKLGVRVVAWDAAEIAKYVTDLLANERP